MSNNSWIAPVSIIAGITILGFGYKFYNDAKETPSYRDDNSQDPYNITAFGGRKSKRRKYRKNASKKRR